MFAIGLIWWVAIAIFVVLLGIATYYDRGAHEEPKWYLIGIGFAALMIFFWKDFTFFGPAHVEAVMEGTKVVSEAQDRVVLADALAGSGFWMPVLAYLGIGLAYSLLEFGLTIRKAERALSAAWQEFITKTRTVPVLDGEGKPVMTYSGNREVPSTEQVPYRTIIAEARRRGEDYQEHKHAIELTKGFADNPRSFNWYRRQEARIVGVEIGQDKLSIGPKVDKGELAEHVGAWTFLWPAYAISLIVGDLFAEFFSLVGSMLAAVSGRVVKFTFRNSFDV